MTGDLHTVLYTGVALVLLTGGGNWACRALFRAGALRDPATTAGESAQRAGWLIGPLERMILAVGLLAHSWEVMAAVIALKTVARFKDLNDRPFAEYFLVGSLFSLLWAVLVTTGWSAYDLGHGADLGSRLRPLIVAPE